MLKLLARHHTLKTRQKDTPHQGPMLVKYRITFKLTIPDRARR